MFARTYLGSDFISVPLALKVASQALPRNVKWALQLPSLLSFHSLTGAFANIDLKELSTAAGGAALIEKLIVLFVAVVAARAALPNAIKNKAAKNKVVFFMIMCFK
jgi:hypothetical protein